MPPKDQVARVQKMLGDEYGTASNIKSRVNRLSVLSAITSAQQRLKLYTRVGARAHGRPRPLAAPAFSPADGGSGRTVAAIVLAILCCSLPSPTPNPTNPTRTRPQVPPNGLVLYTGTILTDEGKEKKVNIDFEPFKPINTSLYLCDNKFHTEALAELLESDNRRALGAHWGAGCARRVCGWLGFGLGWFVFGVGTWRAASAFVVRTATRITPTQPNPTPQPPGTASS